MGSRLLYTIIFRRISFLRRFCGWFDSGIQEDGYILGMVMVFFVVFTILGLAFLKMSGFEKLAVSRQYHKTRAFYHADGGIHKGIWLLNNVSKAAATFSDATVSVSYDSVNLIMKAIGSSGGRQDSLKVTLQASGGSGSGTFTLRPSGSGAYSNNTHSPGSGSNWDKVDEATSDEASTFVYSSGFLWNSDTYITEDPGSNPGTINSVVIFIRVRSLYSGTQTRTIAYTYNTRYYGDIINTHGQTSFTNYSTAYTTNPNTSSAWTWSEVNDMQVGVRNYYYSDCTQVWAQVYYTQAGGGNDYTILTWEEL